MEYKKYNANPKGKKTSDCAVRALCTFLDIPYEIVYMDLCKLGAKMYTVPNDTETLISYLQEKECTVISHIAKKGEKRPRVKDFTQGTHLLFVANHITCVKNGVLLDTWNCSEKSVYRSCTK